MKTKFGTMLLAAAGVVGSVAVAHAAPPEGAAPSAPRPAGNAALDGPTSAPAPAAPAAAPAPAGVAPVPATGAPAAPPTPDTTTPEPKKEDKPKPGSRFGFTRFTWGNVASTKIFGVGQDYVGTEDEVYNMDFTLNLRYAFVQKPRDRAYVNTSIGWDVDITNSDSTTKLRQPFFHDVPVSVGYSHVVYESEDKETRTSPLISTGISIPASIASRAQGKYLGTSLGAGIIHGQKLAGSKNDWFPDVLFFTTAGWGHNFTKSTTATPLFNPESSYNTRIVQTARCSGGQCDSAPIDQLGTGALVHDNVRFNFTYYLSIYKDMLSFGNTWEIALPFKYQFSDGGCLNIATGCAPISQNPNAYPSNMIPNTTFDVSFSYALPSNLGRFDLGYQNITRQLGENGQRRSVFYSPDAMFYGNVVVYFDGIIDKIAESGEKKKSAASKVQNVGALPRFGGGSLSF